MSEATFAGLKAISKHRRNMSGGCQSHCPACYAEQLEKAFKDLRDFGPVSGSWQDALTTLLGTSEEPK